LTIGPTLLDRKKAQHAKRTEHRSFQRKTLTFTAVLSIVAVLCILAVREAGSTKSGTAISATSTTQADKPILLFDDEFNDGSLDATKWSKGWLAPGITPPVNSLEKNCYDPNQVTVDHGELKLTAIAQPETCGGVTRPFAAGLVNTASTFRFTYGYAVARIWLPAGSGVWPAWWTDGQSWPNDGEIDVMEVYNPSRNAAYHYRYAGCGGNCAPGGQTTVASSTSGWHTYAINWQPGAITWYYDGQQVWSFTGSAVVSSPQYLVLNLATNLTTATVPAVMRVDYVRIYKSKP
jgi:beta-glucanase (GH16 family)